MARSIFSKKVDEAENKTKVELENAWIWVDGYKATDKDMKCKDFQYELNKQFDMPEDAEIEDCKSGFHLCRDLNDVFGYYSIGDGTRFFKVRALVRATDYAEYGIPPEDNFNIFVTIRDKLVAKSIIFQSELTPDEILREFARHSDGRRGRLTEADLDTWSDDLKKLAIDVNINEAMAIMRARELVELGYSEPFAHLIIAREGGYELAKAVGSQPDMSMDMKALYIFEGLRSNRAKRDAMISSAQMAAYGTLGNSGRSRRG